MVKIAIIGAGGFGREVAWTAETAGFEVVGFCDDAEVKCVRTFFGKIEDAAQTLPSVSFIIAVGNNAARRKLFDRAVAVGWTPVTVVSPKAIVAPDVQIAAGSYIGPGAVVSVGGKIGRGVIVNNLASVGHDVMLGDFSQICPCVGISGGCVIGEEALLGTNSTVIPLRKIGARAILGAGALALRDIADGESVVRLR